MHETIISATTPTHKCLRRCLHRVAMTMQEFRRKNELTFKEHNTIDIRKGYLNGRYGSIPFLANLHDLNWHQYATSE